MKICANMLWSVLFLSLGCSSNAGDSLSNELGGDADLRRMPFLPNTYVRVTQGANSPYSHNASLSQAIDWSLPDIEDRGMPVTAMQSGVVVSVTRGIPDSRGSGFGNQVDILTPDGEIDRLTHCREIIVGQGEEVEQGQVVCSLGTSGNSTGTHVHSDTRVSGSTQTLELNFFESSGVPQEGRDYSSRNTGPYDRAYWTHGGPTMLGEPSEEARWYFDYVPCDDTDGDSNFICTNEEAHRINVHVLHLRGGLVSRGALIYDALHGARNAVIIHGQFYDWWSSYAGPRSSLGIPIAEEYIGPGSQTRQDGTGGYLTWDESSVSFHSWQDNVCPGEFSSGWDNSVSYLFVRAYKELGGARAGEPVSQFGNPAEVHFWPGTRYLIQDFNHGELGWFTIMYDPENADYGGKNIAIPIAGEFWEYYRAHDGPVSLGAPIAPSYTDPLTGNERMDWETGLCTLVISGLVQVGRQTGSICEIDTGLPVPDPTEVCDGADNDGDGLSDENFICLAGSDESCITSCGTIGTRHCSEFCTWESCAGDCMDDSPVGEDVLSIRFTPYDNVTADFIYYDWSGGNDGSLIRGWAEQCLATGVGSIECSIVQPGSSFVEFNINYAERWACESSSHNQTGSLVVIWQASTYSAETVDNGFEGCNFHVNLP